MRKILTIALLLTFCLINAQAFKGKGDGKLNVGMVVQNGGTGIEASADHGLGENFSFGILVSYLLNVEGDIDNMDFSNRFDAKLRFNANIGSVINIDPKFDFYPGLNLGLKNFGGHIGARYLFTDGFGIFSEYAVPIAKYDPDATSKYNNSWAFNIGFSFNLE